MSRRDPQPRDVAPTVSPWPHLAASPSPPRPRRLALAGLALGALSLAGCTGGSPEATPSNTVEMPTASYSPPADAQVTPPQLITLANVQPNDGIQPVIDFIESARSSVDISIYRIDSDFTPLIEAQHLSKRSNLAVALWSEGDRSRATMQENVRH